MLEFHAPIQLPAKAPEKVWAPVTYAEFLASYFGLAQPQNIWRVNFSTERPFSFSLSLSNTLLFT